MDILVLEKDLRYFLKTKADLGTITKALCESGPTVDRIKSINNQKILEIEVITNRIDCASVFGIAREANTILNQKGVDSKLENNPYTARKAASHQTQKINLRVENTKKVFQFLAVTIDSIKITQSSEEIKNTLISIGQRPINNLVDLTNLYTYLYGYPSHVFDKDKIDMSQITLRESNENEKIKLLDDSEIKLQKGDLIIEDGSKNIIDLCCVMGGKHAIVDQHTKNILLIIPTCDPKQVRKTSLAHQKRTLAAQIFEKKPDTTLAPFVFSLLVGDIINNTKAHLSSDYLVLNNLNQEPKEINLNLKWLEKFVGQPIDQNQSLTILENLGFRCHKPDINNLIVTIPTFRFDDINNQEDLAEEITRIYGYKNITPIFPVLSQPSEHQDMTFSIENKIRNTLSTLGYHEVINNSLLSEKQIISCGQEPENYLKLKNALSEDLQYMRTNLGISTIANHKSNQGTLNLKFFEIGNIYQKINEKPLEIPHLCFSAENIALLKETLNILVGHLKLTDKINLKITNNYPSYIDKNNHIGLFTNEAQIGYIGQTNSLSTIKNSLEKPISIVEIDISKISSLKPEITYLEKSIYPDIIEDLNITSNKSLGEIYGQISNQEMISKIIYLNSFQNKHTFRVHFSSNQKNLSHDEVDQIKKKIVDLVS